MRNPAGRLACAMLLAAALWARAETVRDIRIVNLGRNDLDEGFIRLHLSIKPGAEASAADISRDVKALLDTGRFTTVQVQAEPVQGGVALVFSVKHKYRLAREVAITGAGAIGERTLRDLIKLEAGDFFDDAALAARAKKVEDAYIERFHAGTRVSWQLRPTNERAGLAEASFAIAESGVAGVYRFAFEGNRQVSSADLRKAIGSPPWWNLKRRYTGRRYDMDQLEAAADAVREAYRARGYLDAAVGQPALEPVRQGSFARLALGRPRIDATRLIARLPVQEGVRYRFGSLAVRGAAAFPESDLRAAMGVRAGDVASVQAIGGAGRALSDYYRGRGYVKAAVRTDTTPRAAGVLDAVYTVTEGKPGRIRDIRISGNTRTHDKVIRRELLVNPGELYDESRVRKSEKRVMNLGFFGSAAAHLEPTQKADEYDVVMDVTEKPSGHFMVGAGFSSIDKLMGYMEIAQGNFDIAGWPRFTGAGQKLKFRVQVGSNERDYELSFVEPWFMDRKLSLGTEFYSRAREYDEYDIDRTGASITIGRPVGFVFNRADLRYTIEDAQVKDVANTNAYQVLDTEPGRPAEWYRFAYPSSLKSELALSLVRDTRDSPFLPTRGERFLVSASIAGGPVGGDVEVFGAKTEVDHYVPLWFGHVLGFHAEMEVAEEQGDMEDLPPFERLFAGGPNTIRGFRYRDVGPKAAYPSSSDPQDVRPIGGRTRALASAEYSVPVAKMFRAAGFVDAGNVWLDAFDFDFANYAMGAGVGIRLDMPGFPIRIDYAWPIQKDSDFTRTRPWSISMKYGF